MNAIELRFGRTKVLLQMIALRALGDCVSHCTAKDRKAA